MNKISKENSTTEEVESHSLSRRNFIAISAATSAALLLSRPSADAQNQTPEGNIIGPLVGHTDTSSTILWARFPQPGTYTISLRPVDGGAAQEVSAEATAEADNTVQWKVSGLSPATRYEVKLKDGRPCSFTTPPANDTPAKVTLAIGSCARENAGTREVWTRMMAEKADAVVLAGDTPYIDTTNLMRQRSRHRTFASVAEYQALLSTRPFWSTWDDHDFGGNDVDGTLKGKENSRRAFMEYRAQQSYGTGQEGIYTSFRWGPIEVFLIDARWWSYTGPSFADPTKKTLLGNTQWEWLANSLATSTAPFKLLTPGMIWEDKQNGEKDDWETYAHERIALFNFIKSKRIPGVMLFGGDIHVTRLLRYPVEHVGYPLYDFISSPMHDGVIPGLDKPHPYLLQSKVQPHTFLTLSVDSTVQPATLTARFLNTQGQSLFPDTVIGANELVPTAV